MNNDIAAALTDVGGEPVLVDVGASGEVPKQWRPFAPQSVYLGFDPDSRLLYEPKNSGFKRAIMFNRAITDQPGVNTVQFNLARSPTCSSVLPPHPSLKDYIFSDLFEVERQVSASATTLDEALRECQLERIDWLKLDTQGTDLRLFRSLSTNVREKVLAVDLEPGLVDVYQGEDLFAETHISMRKAGFWLSHLEVKGTVRMQRKTLDRLVANKESDLTPRDVMRCVPPSPGWCEARYLRTLDHLAANESGLRDYVVLWCFALGEGHHGYALDIAAEVRLRFGAASTRPLQSAPLRAIQRQRMRPLNLAKRMAPTKLKAWVRGLVAR